MEFNDLNAMPISDLFIAKRSQTEQKQWKLFDAYKLNFGYNIEITENGMIESMKYEDKLSVIGAKFSSVRRQNLKGVNVTCGLVVFYLDYFVLYKKIPFAFISHPRRLHIPRNLLTLMIRQMHTLIFLQKEQSI